MTEIRPQPTQEQFLSSSADIVIFGGAAGGGKNNLCYNYKMEYENNKAYIYMVADPSDGRAAYIGRTITTIKQRFRDHKSVAKRKGTSRFHKWLKNVLESGAVVKAVLLEECEQKEMSDRENYWIKKMLPKFNQKIGHDGGKKKSDLDWSPYLHLLGVEHDGAIAMLAGVTRKAVSYKRNCLGVPKTTKPQRIVVTNNIAGWNKIKLPNECIVELGNMPDYKLADRFGVSKCVIRRERIRRSIKSYAEQTGNDGKVKKGNSIRKGKFKQKDHAANGSPK